VKTICRIGGGAWQAGVRMFGKLRNQFREIFNGVAPKIVDEQSCLESL
jgi:hypothetical protein